MSNLEMISNERIARSLALPTPAQIKAERAKHGLTQAQAGAVVHAAERTWQEWEAGRREMNLANWELFTLKMG